MKHFFEKYSCLLACYEYIVNVLTRFNKASVIDKHNSSSLSERSIPRLAVCLQCLSLRRSLCPEPSLKQFVVKTSKLAQLSSSSQLNGFVIPVDLPILVHVSLSLLNENFSRIIERKPLECFH